MKSFVQKISDAPQPVQFELDDVRYTFNPPKQSSLMLGMFSVNSKDDMAMFDRISATFDWFYTGLDRKHFKEPHTSVQKGCQACTIHARLADPDDALEIDTVQDIINWLMSESSGRPTT